MKKRGIWIMGMLCLAGLLWAGKSVSPLELGEQPPKMDYIMKNITGENVSLKKIKGENGLLVVFSCNTCPYVRAWEGRYPGIAMKAAEAKVGVIMVNPNEGRRDGGDSFEDMVQHAKENGYMDEAGKPLFAYALDKDHQLADAFGATRTPEVFLFDKELNLVYRGAIDDNSKNPEKVEEKFLLDALAALQSGTKIAKSSTRSIGCSIKRL